MKSVIDKIMTLGLTFLAMYTFACDACKLQQPKITRNITHGTGPESNWDWFIVGIVMLITVFALIYSVKYLIRPGEKDKNHIKYSVFSDQSQHYDER